MTMQEVKEFLTKNLVNHRRDIYHARIAERYYRGENDILFAEKGEEKELEVLRNADNRIPHSFYPLLVNQKAAYIFSDPPIFVTGSKSCDAAVRRVLGSGFAKKCKSLCICAANCGYAWLHYWQGRDGSFCYGVLDGTCAVGVYSDDLFRELLAVIRVYRKKVEDTTEVVYEIWDAEVCRVYAHEENSDIMSGLREFPCFGRNSGRTNVYRHGFGVPPFILFANNETKSSDLAPIKRLIDIFDKTYSGFANDLEDIQEVILTLSGYGGTDITEFLTDLKKYKVIKLDDLSEKPGVDTLNIEIPVQAREKMLEITRKAIFEEGQGVDPQQNNFGNASGVALQFMYSLLELKAGLLETEFRGGFEALVQAICRYYGIQIDTVGQVWTRTAVRNDAELAEIAVKSRGMLSDETIISRHPWVEDVAAEMGKIDREQGTRRTSAEDQ